METLNIFIRSIFIDNMVFAFFFGMCSYIAVSKSVKTALGLGAAVTFVQVMTVPLNYLLYNYVLKADVLVEGVDLSFLTFIIFIATIAAFVQLVEMIVEKFFIDYKRQVENHFAYEESVVFPYVRALIKGEQQESYTIEQFEENHSNIDETLNDLKNIVMKYLPETCDNVLRNEVLYRIFRLEADLARHTLIENMVLIPMVNKLEER